LVVLTGAAPAAILCLQSGAGNTATLAVTHSALFASNLTHSGTCAPVVSANVDLTGLTLGFANVAGNDYTPSFGSPLIDAGTSGASADSTDLLGRPRVVNGGSGTAVRDIGAFEYQPPAPVAKPALFSAVKLLRAVVKRSGGTWTVLIGARAQRAAVIRLSTATAGVVRITMAHKVGHTYRAIKGAKTLKLGKGSINLGFRGTWQRHAAGQGQLPHHHRVIRPPRLPRDLGERCTDPEGARTI